LFRTNGEKALDPQPDNAQLSTVWDTQGNLKMTLFAAFISILAFLAFLLFIVLSVYVWIRRRSYIRERFAFLAFTSCVTLTVGVIGTIAGNASPLKQILIIIHYLREGEILNTSLNPILSALIVLILWGIYALAYLLFRSWDGQKSKETYQAIRAGRDRELIQEALVELSRIWAGKPKIDFFKPPAGSPHLPDLGQPVDPIPWRELSKILLKMQRNALEFSDWRTEHDFWLAHHKDFNHGVAIKCSVDMPDKSALEEFVGYVSKMQNPPEELILAVQAKTNVRSTCVNGQSIEVISQGDLLNGLIDFSEYKEKIRERVMLTPLPDSPLTLNKTYVTPRFCRDGETTPEPDIEQAINDWLNDTSYKQLAILGEYGQGKSTTALMLTHHLLAKGVENLNRIPILIELRGKSPATMTTGELLATWGHTYGVESRRLQALHEAGRLLLIFDGFDEMALVGNPHDRLRHFQTLWSFNHPTAKLIFTGRPNLFLDDNELKAALGIKRGGSGKLTCEAWYLEKFNLDEISMAIRCAPEDVQQGVVKAVTMNTRLRDIASRPSLLHVISVLWGDGDLSYRAAQLTPAELMHRFLDASLQRQTEKARELRRREIAAAKNGKHEIEPKNYMVLNSAERRYFMLGIGVHMMKTGETNQIHLTDLNEITEKLARACPDSISLTSDAIDSNPNMPIKRRIEQSNDFLGRLLDDVRTCGLLVRDVIDGAFRFGHKSFLEYLAADYSERKHAHVEDEDIGAIDSVMNVSFTDVLRNNVVRSYFGELLIWRRADGLGSEFAPAEVASFLMDKILRPSWFRKQIWRISAATLRHYEKHENSAWLRGVLYRNIVHPFSIMALQSFVASRFDRKPSRRRVNLILFALLTFTYILTIVHYANYIMKSLYISVYARISSDLMTFPMYIFLMLSMLLLLFIFTSESQRYTLLGKTWVDVCRDQGFSIEHLYAALLGNKIPSTDYKIDPVGIFTVRRAEPEAYELESDETLREKVSASKIAWNRGVAAWVLGRRHSEFGGIVFSREFDGLVPPWDSQDAMKSSRLQKAGRKASLSPEALTSEIESLNNFLGWDIRQGVTSYSDDHLDLKTEK
jgi:hypothetical protein